MDNSLSSQPSQAPISQPVAFLNVNTQKESKKPKKLLWFLLILLILITLLVSGYIFWQRYQQSRRSPSTTGNGQFKEIKFIKGKFLTTDDYIPQTPTTYLCVSSQEEFDNLIENILNLPENKNKLYIERDLLPKAMWYQKPEYFAIQFDYVSEPWHALNCNYFVSSNILPTNYKSPVGKNVTKTQIGYFKQLISKQSVEQLINFLQEAKILPTIMQGFMTSKPTKTYRINEKSSEISIFENYKYSIGNDLPPYDSTNVSIDFNYSILKEDGSVFFSAQ